MSPILKMLLGGLATAFATWFLYGPMGWGTKCAPAAASAPVVASTAPEAPANAEAVKTCQTDVDTVIAGKTVNFESGRAVIKADSIALLEALATASKACAGTQIEVAGHTDQTGNDAANLRLSEERANAVVAALTERGVPVERLLPKGYGETKLIDAAMTPEALAKNRRIEFRVAASAATAAAPTAQ